MPAEGLRRSSLKHAETRRACIAQHRQPLDILVVQLSLYPPGVAAPQWKWRRYKITCILQHFVHHIHGHPSRGRVSFCCCCLLCIVLHLREKRPPWRRNKVGGCTVVCNTVYTKHQTSAEKKKENVGSNGRVDARQAGGLLPRDARVPGSTVGGVAPGPNPRSARVRP